MIKVIIFLSLLIEPSYAKDFKPKETIDKILNLNNPKDIHKNLIILKKENKKFIRTLLKEKSYKPVIYDYATTLEILLDNIPHKVEFMPTCKSLREKMLSDYKTTWEHLSPPSHKIWPVFQKICK